MDANPNYFLIITGTVVLAVTGIAIALYIAYSSKRELTIRKRAEEALRESEERYRTVADFTYAWETWVDPQGKNLYVSPSCERISGYSTDEFMSDSQLLLKITHPDDLEKLREHYDKPMGSPEPDIIDFRIKHYSGEERWISHVCQPVVSAAGEFLGRRGSNRDITERKQAEDRLIESEQQLRSLAAHLASSREETMIAISRDLHDELGQILTGLKMDAAWLNGKITNEQQPLKEKVESIVGDLNDTIQVVKRITARLRPVILDNQGLVPALRYEVQEFEKRTGIACSFTIEPPELTTDKDHSTAFYRIVQESLTNITKHAQASKVAISLKADQDQLVLKIQDNGIGITTEQTESLGAYGLLGMRERVLHLDGEIKIQGAQGQGTQLSVALPVRRKDRK